LSGSRRTLGATSAKRARSSRRRRSRSTRSQRRGSPGFVRSSRNTTNGRVSRRPTTSTEDRGRWIQSPSTHGSGSSRPRAVETIETSSPNQRSERFTDPRRRAINLTIPACTSKEKARSARVRLGLGASPAARLEVGFEDVLEEHDHRGGAHSGEERLARIRLLHRDRGDAAQRHRLRTYYVLVVGPLAGAVALHFLLILAAHAVGQDHDPVEAV